MPWKETRVTDERMQLILEHLGDGWSMSEVCVAHGVSRKTGYKWRQRYEEQGVVGLADRSRAPRHHPNAAAVEVVALLVAARRAHPSWGPRKVRAWLRARQPALELPAASTIGQWFTRAGLVRARPRRARRAAVPTELRRAAAPNDVWCGDFKGWFRLGNGHRCLPLTLSDACSRYLLRCHGVARGDTAEVQAIFASAFREYGLPAAIRTDNGPPFASVGLGGLSRLAVWWIKLGIWPERIAPGHPEQNGRHERFHRTLAEAVTRPPRANAAAQQRAFATFRRLYNEERPHQALGDQPPACCYTPSPRPYPRRLPSLEYPAHWEVRAVRSSGEIKWAGERIYVSEALAGEWIGLEPLRDDHWRLALGPVPLALLDAATKRLLPYRPTAPGAAAAAAPGAHDAT